MALDETCARLTPAPAVPLAVLLARMVAAVVVPAAGVGVLDVEAPVEIGPEGCR